jgi:hypothetical protein
LLLLLGVRGWTAAEKAGGMDDGLGAREGSRTGVRVETERFDFAGMP